MAFSILDFNNARNQIMQGNVAQGYNTLLSSGAPQTAFAALLPHAANMNGQQAFPMPSTGGGSNVPAPQQNSTPSAPSAPAADPYAQIKSDIGNSWDQYINTLNDTSNSFLPQQKTAQEAVANSQYDQGVNTITTQKAKSLRDIADNTRHAFQAANVFLGQNGAGDSSAANQYSFAINQNTNKQTGNLNEFVNTQLSNLSSQRDQQLANIANWFAQAQATLRQSIAQGQLNKAQDINNLSRSILDRATQETSNVKQNAQNQYNALVQWAANNSTNLDQLRTNIQGIPQVLGQPMVDSAGNYNMPIGLDAIKKAKVDSTGNYRIPTGVGSFVDTTKRDIFGNPVNF